MKQKNDLTSGRNAQLQNARLVETCLVIHNLLLDLQDDTDVDYFGVRMLDQEDVAEEHAFESATDAVALRDSIDNYLFDNRARL